MKRTKVLGYARVSTTDQADHGVSIENQIARINAYVAAFPDLDLVGIEIDAGESAKSLDRPALQRAFATLRSGRATAMIVVEMSRLTRSVRDLQTVIEFFNGRRSLLAVNEQIDTRSPDGQLRLNIMASVHQHARQSGAARTSSAMQHMRARGMYTGGEARYGFRLADDGETLVAVASEQAIITEARTLRAAGLALRAVSATLAERGVMARSGRPFGPEMIRRMAEAA